MVASQRIHQPFEGVVGIDEVDLKHMLFFARDGTEVIFLRLHEYLHFYMFTADLGDALGFGPVYDATREMEKSAGGELVGAIGLTPDAFLLSVLIVNAPVTQPDAGTHKLLLMSD